jgi:hypothetical protein
MSHHCGVDVEAMRIEVFFIGLRLQGVLGVGGAGRAAKLQQ